MIGGVFVDFEGCIILKGLLVVGEVIFIGLYGVNCLVLNSLLEGFVYGVYVGVCVF